MSDLVNWWTTRWKKLPPPMRNRYFVTAALFVLYMVFFATHDVLTQMRLQRTVNRLEESREFYEGKIEEAKQERMDMEVNKERFARENYYMQRNDEDVFIITQE